MQGAKLQAEVRQSSTKGERNRLRAIGLVPAIIYGPEIGSLQVAIPQKELDQVVAAGGLIQIAVNNGGNKQEVPVLVREVQRDPLRRVPVHVDFYQVSMGRKLVTTVPLVLAGDSPGVGAGGVLQQTLREVEVECLPADLPEALEVDISGLEIGDKFTVADLASPAGVEVVSDPEAMILAVVAPRVAEEEEAEEPVKEETAPAEGE
ncbi:MAG: 50S ribosomal protein L25 [Bacillota bacterium]